MSDRRVVTVEYERYPILRISLALCQFAFSPQVSIANSHLAIGNRLNVFKLRQTSP